VVEWADPQRDSNRAPPRWPAAAAGRYALVMQTSITTDPDVLGGKPCIRGTRISVEFILELLASGASHQQILDAYPQVSADALAEALRYAARSMRSDVVWNVDLPG
jgi:uncharacterized protein (DUF433 family)